MSLAKLRIVRHYLRAKWAFPHLRGEPLKSFQESKAREMVRFAAAHSPFYREHWQECDLSEWQQLPTVDKSVMMANFDAFNTVGLRREDALEIASRAERNRDFAPTLQGFTVGLSSGTSGHRGLFVVSAEEQEAWAGTLLARVLPGLRRQGWRVALFLRSNSNLYEQVGNRLITFRYFDLMLPSEEAVAQLAGFQPDILVAPPSHLSRLARSIATQPASAAERLCPKRIISVAEVLQIEEREWFQERFHAPVGEIYQATEGLLGVTCACGSLHIQEDVIGIQLETIDPSQPQYVTPILTDLWRRTQPIVRYRLGDIWIMDDRLCPCGSGFRIIRHVLGRLEDIVYFPCADTATGRHAVFPDVIHEWVTSEINCDHAETSAPSVLPSYQVVQERCGHLCLHLDVAPECFAETATRLRASILLRLKQLGCECGVLEIVAELQPQPPNAKRQMVRNLYKFSPNPTSES